jgi:hypothetical protein
LTAATDACYLYRMPAGLRHRLVIFTLLATFVAGSSESLTIAGFTFPAAGGRLTPTGWASVLDKCQLLLGNDRLDAFANLAGQSLPYVPVGYENDGELLAAEIQFHAGKGLDAYQRVKKLTEPLTKMTAEERREQALIKEGWLRNFLLRIAAYPLIAKEVRPQKGAEGSANDVQQVNHSVYLSVMDLRNALNLCDLLRGLDGKGFVEINKALLATFSQKRTFAVGFQNHGRVEITPERACDQAIISLDMWAKPALPNSLARQIQIYWGMDFFSYSLPRSISIYDLTYATTSHVKYEEGKIVRIETYGTEDVDRGYRAYAETSGSVEASLVDVLGWFGISPTAWHASVPTAKTKEEKAPAVGEEVIPSESPGTSLPLTSPDSQ